MGIHGLTTFIQQYHNKYKEKAYLRDCPVVIDGCNLMFFLYFEGRQGQGQGPPASGTPKRNSAGGSGSGSPLSKASPLKSPHLFGGDYNSYAQNVREFFQHLKLCNIMPIVVFDGAYDSMKIKTAYRRFAENIKDNVRSSGVSLKGVTPGPSYTPVFMKAVFVEILQEQKIPHYQTEGEADSTIAFIARKLGNCPILSSDSDFHIYLNAKILPLHSLRFKKVCPPKEKRNSANTSTSDSPSGSGPASKILTLHSEYVSLAKLCREEFKMTDTRMLPVAAVILGNDWIRTSAFSSFHTTTTGRTKAERNARIAYLLKWLGRQKSYDGIISEMLSTVKDSRGEQTRELVNEIIAIYGGLSGEEKVFEMLVAGGQLAEFLKTKTDPDEKLNSTSESDPGDKILDDLENLSLNDKTDEETTNLSGLEDSQVDNEIAEGDHDQNENDDVGLDDVHNSDDEDELGAKIESNKNQLKLPDWYIDAHLKCQMPTYLLKLARNRMVFLSPQAEVSCLPSTHTMSTQIIQVIGGIFLGENENITLITRKQSKLLEVIVPTIGRLENWGVLPRICENSEDIRKMLSVESKSLLILETLGLNSPEVVAFINQWSASLKIWIICLMFFLKKSSSTILDIEIGNESFNFTRKTSIPVALGILISVIKNIVLSPSGTKRISTGLEKDAKISDLLNQSNPTSLSNLRKFYVKYERVVDASSRNFTRSYDISRTFNLCQFICILFHVHQLNRLLGDPFKAPRLNYNLNNWLVYNFSGELTLEDGNFIGSENDFGDFISEKCGVKEIGIVVAKILHFSDVT